MGDLMDNLSLASGVLCTLDTEPFSHDAVFDAILAFWCVKGSSSFSYSSHLRLGLVSCPVSFGEKDFRDHDLGVSDVTY